MIFIHSIEINFATTFAFETLQKPTMRRNLTSLLKFLCLCLITVLLTASLYKTFFHGHDGVSERLTYGARRAHPHQGAFFSGSAKNVQQKKIDWHDYRFIEWEKSRVGIGEHGTAAHTLPEEEGDRRRLFDTNGFNALLSMNYIFKYCRLHACFSLNYWRITNLYSV